MDDATQKELLVAAKKALKIIAAAGQNEDFVFELRDLLRKAENGSKNSIHHVADELH